MSAAISAGKLRPPVLVVAAFAVGIAVTGVVGLVAQREAGNEGGGRLHPSGPRRLTDILDPSKPLMLSGAQTSLDEVAALSGFPVYTPADRADGSPEVWLSVDTHEVAIRYGTDLVLLLTPWPAAAETDPAAPYDAQAREMNAGYTTTISEHPAWVLPSRGDSEGDGSVSVVHLMIDGIDVTLYGTMHIDELVRVAESVR